jgi:hypothetical protein
MGDLTTALRDNITFSDMTCLLETSRTGERAWVAGDIDRAVVQRAPGLTPAVLRMLDVCGNHMGDIDACLAGMTNVPKHDYEHVLECMAISVDSVYLVLSLQPRLISLFNHRICRDSHPHAVNVDSLVEDTAKHFHSIFTHVMAANNPHLGMLCDLVYTFYFCWNLLCIIFPMIRTIHFIRYHACA